MTRAFRVLAPYHRLRLLSVGGLVVLALTLARQGQSASVGTRVEVSGGAYTNVTPSALKSLLDRKDVFLVNVHVPYEGEIAGTDAFIPYNKAQEQLHLLPAKKDAAIVLYCMSDRMSTIAAETLVRLGYTDIRNLQGGMAAWGRQGYPLLHAPR